MTDLINLPLTRAQLRLLEAGAILQIEMPRLDMDNPANDSRLVVVVRLKPSKPDIDRCDAGIDEHQA